MVKQATLRAVVIGVLALLLVMAIRDPQTTADWAKAAGQAFVGVADGISEFFGRISG